MDRSKDCLVITRAFHEHNHETGPELYRCYSENRQLDNSALCKVQEMTNLNVQPQLISSNLRAFTGKSITNKDIHNFVSKLRQKNTADQTNEDQLKSQLDSIIASDPDATARIITNESKEVVVIYLQSGYMKQAFKKFPELCFLDGTYKTNEYCMPLYTIMIEDGNGVSLPIAHF